MKPRTLIAPVLCAALLAGREITGAAESVESVRTVEDGAPVARVRIKPRTMHVPAGPGSSVPNLSASVDNRPILSWMEELATGGHVLRMATLADGRWTPPSTIAEGDSFFVNWADFPSVVCLGDGSLVAHWLWKNGEGPYAYDVRLSRSSDAGRTWGRPLSPHRDGTQTEHGFVSLLPERKGVRAIWLDGRKMADTTGTGDGPGPEMTLRTAHIRMDGTLGDETELDNRACDCCQTAAAATERGVVVIYRDRSEEEVRDMSVVRLEGGRWSAPTPLHADGWRIAGCPVNGPAIDAQGMSVVVAWFTHPADSARVSVAFSGDAGASFGDPVRVDNGNPLGRVDVVLLADGSALVTWLERRGEEAAVLARHVGADKRADKPVTIARTSASRASGFPRALRIGDRVYFAWTEAGSPSRLRMAVALLDASIRP